MKTIVLLSGGLDSATVLAMEYQSTIHPNELSAIAFDYGQPHKIELTRARLIAESYRAPFEVLRLPDMPLVNDVVFAGRNLVFAAAAIAHAQATGKDRIAVGCNASDFDRFPDCRGTFWQPLKECAKAYGITVVTPLLAQSKADVVRIARSLAVPIELTWSCYSPRKDAPCGKCLACKTREEALQ
jgi:7-cyano-7-deazaguanine synthase